MLKVKNIDVYYDEFHVLNKASLEVNPGECVALLGANGAGKSTLINAISGIVPIKSGEILFENNNISLLPSYEIVNLGIIQVPEGRQLFPALTLRENLQMGAFCPRAKMNRRESLERVLELLPALKDKLNRLAGSLSGGEQQMCAIGRGLMASPKVIMLDEPSLGLSPKMVETVFDIVERINKMGTAVLIVEQNVHISLEISRRAYVLENGHVLMEGLSSMLKNDNQLKKAYLGIA